jgi:hypothetical protein
MIGKIREATERRVLWLDAETMVKQLNRVLIGRGELLQSPAGPQGVSGDRSLHPASAPPVAMQEA